MADVRGEPSTSQPAFPALDGSDEFWIVHYPRAEDLMSIAKSGYQVVMLICVRETQALISSMVRRDHVDSVYEAEVNIRKNLVENVGKASVLGFPFEIVTYEGWTDGAIAHFFPRHGLVRKRHDLKVSPVRGVDGPVFKNGNAKHYAVR
jgi:hypothetical protein